MSSYVPQQPPPPDLADALAAGAARLEGWATTFLWFPEISSTNDVAIRAADAGGEEGLVVAADMQHAGRGRVGRRWESPAGAGLYVSCLLRPDAETTRWLTVAVGLGAAEAVERTTGLPPTLKWPNDLLFDGRKIGGVLAEAGVSSDGRTFVVVGLGINLTSHHLPHELQAVATSIEHETGRAVDRAVLLVELLAAVRRRYRELRDGRRAEVLAAWRARASSIVGRAVEWEGEDGMRAGVVEAIDDDASLRIRCVDGEVRVIAGEVRWR